MVQPAVPDVLPRMMVPRLMEALQDSPVVVLHGPRQCGKTTFVRQIGGEHGYAYFSLDDSPLLDAVRADPAGFVGDLPPRVILDEVQRAPEIFMPIKAAVDRDRRPGRFLLTGSANVLFLPNLADSLAGRMHVARLHPFAQCEIERTSPQFLNLLFDPGSETRRYARLSRELAERIVMGGYPEAYARASARRRAAWYSNYLTSLIQRDVRDLADISSLDALTRLLEMAAGQTARLINVSELASPFQLSRPTIRSYVTLLEHVFLVEELRPWFSNRLKRLVKTPKLHLGDTGLASALLGLDAPTLYQDREIFGQLVETFVYQELRRMEAAHDEDHRFFFFRDRDDYEVDIVVQRGRRIAGVEVKVGATVRESDFRGLKKLAASVGSQFAAGVVLYDGEFAAPFGDRLWALPIRTLWETR